MTGKANVQQARNEKLARRNPDRIQRDIDDLEKVASAGGTLSEQEEQALARFKKDLVAVRKAREALGDKAPTFGRGPYNGRDSALGKRRRDDSDESEDERNVPEEVRQTPMPRDTPPPIPKEVLDRWWTKRRARWDARREADEGDGSSNRHNISNTGGGSGRGGGSHGTDSNDPRSAHAVVAPQQVYSSQPVLRDLRKEAAVFMPTSVRSRVAEAGTGEPPPASIETVPRRVEAEDDAYQG